MSTLLLRIAAPMQSYGYDSKYNKRNSFMCPTKSAVIGMLGCALGIPREGDFSDLTALRFGVRIDNPGVMLTDFQTARTERSGTHIEEKEYICDGVFLVGLESDNTDFLNYILNSLQNKYNWSLRFGKMGCPLVGQFELGVSDKPLIDALREKEWLVSAKMQKRLMGRNLTGEYKLRIFVESYDEDGDLIKDLPVSFRKKNRKYSYRFQKDCGYFPVKTALNDIYTSSDNDWFNF